jgi:hypothetical protein
MRSVRAEPPQARKTRDELRSEARAACDKHDHLTALKKDKEALDIKSTPSLLKVTAEEAMDVHVYAEAYAFASSCYSDLVPDPAALARLSASDQALAQQCAQLQTEAGNFIGFITLEAPQPPDGLRVKVAGELVLPAQFGKLYAVMPGPTPIEATAPGYETHSEAPDVRQGDKRIVRISLNLAAPKPSGDTAPTAVPAVRPAPSPTPVVTPGPTPGPTPVSTTTVVSSSSAPTASSGSTYEIAGVVTAGVGVVSLIVGAFYGSKAKDAGTELSSKVAPGRPYDDSLMATDSRGRGDQTKELIFLSIGGVAAVGGAVLYIIGASQHGPERPTTTTTTASVSILPALSSHDLGASMSVRF